MDVYRSYIAQNSLSETNLSRAGYTPSQIRQIRRQTFAGINPDDFDSLRKIYALGYTKKETYAVWKEITNLLDNYHCRFMIGNCSSIPCSVWRAERILMNDETTSRFANCIHLFEKNEVGSPSRYLGYVFLRPCSDGANQGGFAYTTVANLVAPRYLLRPRYHIISCVTGAADGILPNRGVPFSSPGETESPNRSIASCLHAAMQEALLLKMNSFGCVPISSMDMITCLWRLKHREGMPLSLQDVSELNITLEDGLNFLRDPTTRANGNLQTFWAERTSENVRTFTEGVDYPSEKAARQAARRVMMDYLSNGMPLIMTLRLNDYRSNRTDNADFNHAVMVFGMHVLNDPSPAAANEMPDADEGVLDSIDMRELPDRFVVHDTSIGPYSERTVDRLLQEAWYDDNLSFLAITPPKCHLGILQLRQRARQWIRDIQRMNPDYWESYKRSVGVEHTTVPNDPSQFRYIIRLLSRHQAEIRYLTSEDGNSVVADLNQGQQDADFFWCVEVRLPHEHSSSRYESYSGGDTPPGIVLIWNAADVANQDNANTEISPDVPRIMMRYEEVKQGRNGKMNETYYFYSTDDLSREGQTHVILRRRA